MHPQRVTEGRLHQSQGSGALPDAPNFMQEGLEREAHLLG
jgi:hypothetical protein